MADRNSKVGDIFEMWATDKGVKADTQAWATKTGNEMTGQLRLYRP